MLPPIESSTGRAPWRGPSGPYTVVGEASKAGIAPPTLALVAPDDAKLHGQAMAGDDRAFAALYHRHARQVAEVVYRLAGNDRDLDDLVEEAFRHAGRSRAAPRGDEGFRDGLLRFAIRRLGRRRRLRWLVRAAGMVRPTRSDPRARRRVDAPCEALDAAPSKLRDPGLPWDELRERRVLARLQARRQAGREDLPWRRITLGAAACVLVVIVAFSVHARHATRPLATALAAPLAASTAPVSSSPAPGIDREQHLAFADGTQAVLVRQAVLQVAEQRSDLVHMAQQNGEVRYEVRSDPSREFVVSAAGLTVRARGTVFTVTVETADVEVSVQRGEVEVNDGSWTRAVFAGESLRIPVRRKS